MEIVGRELEIGFSTEATRGSAESTVDKWLRNTDVTVVERELNVEDDTTRGRLEDMENRRVVQKWVEGSINGIIHVDAIGYLYTNIYGKVATSNVSGSVYDHEFTLKQNIDHESLTLFAKDGDVQQLKYAGCNIGTLEISAAVDDFLRHSTNFVGMTAEDDTSTPAYDTEYDFIGRDITIKIADSEAGLASAEAVKIKDVTITHDQGQIRDHVFGSQTPDDVYNAKSMISGEFTKNFVDETFKDLYLSDMSKYMSITIEGEADLGGGNHPTITYVFNKVMINDWNRDGANDDLVTETVSFRAYYNESDEEASKVTLRNLTSAYANVPSN